MLIPRRAVFRNANVFEVALHGCGMDKHLSDASPRWRHWIATIPAMLGCFALVLLQGGCRAIPVYEQDLASKRAMTFDDTGAELTRNSLTAQVEPGSATGQSSTGGGCTSCK